VLVHCAAVSSSNTLCSFDSPSSAHGYSGMTHSWGTLSKPLQNPEQYSPTLWQQYQSLAAKTMIRLLHYLCPWTDILDATGLEHIEHGGGENATVQGLQFSLEQNFGEVEMDWEAGTMQIRALGHQDSSPPLLMAQVHLDQLRGHQSLSTQLLSQEEYEAEWQRNPGGRYPRNPGNHSRDDTDTATWVCVNHRGRDTAVQHLIGHVSSAVILTILVPIPLVAPLTLISLLALMVVRRWAAARRHPSVVPRYPRYKPTPSYQKRSTRVHLDWMAGVLLPKSQWVPLVKQH
jgi:hypothetical protein